jgi:hypothetical protein
MPEYVYKVLIPAVEETYKRHTDKDIYEALGKVDFTKATLTVIADSEEESEAIRKGITDIHMWVADSSED